MKRPTDQVKLLLVGFLRTASALATRDSKFGMIASLSTSAHHNNNNNNNQQQQQVFYNSPDIQQQQLPNLILRVARPKDVPSISVCNCATLPENYNDAFYTNHIRQWPDLALVAVMDTTNDNHDNRNNNNRYGSGGSSGGQAPHLNYHPSSGSSSGNNEHNVVAYVLGKVEERMVPANHNYYDDVHSFMGRQQYTTEFIGHVTSLAVLEPYRRLGLAASLMNQFHYHLEHHTNAVTVCGLHVRKSNIAATRLYERFGYSVTETIQCYYQDGEDAYYMTRPISPTPISVNSSESHQRGENENHHAGFLGNIMFGRRNNHSSNTSRGSTSFFLRNNNNKQQPWEYGPAHLRLPRPVGRRYPPAEQQQQNHQGHHQQGDHHVLPELMTGTM